MQITHKMQQGTQKAHITERQGQWPVEVKNPEFYFTENKFVVEVGVTLESNPN